MGLHFYSLSVHLVLFKYNKRFGCIKLWLREDCIVILIVEIKNIFEPFIIIGCLSVFCLSILNTRASVYVWNKKKFAFCFVILTFLSPKKKKRLLFVDLIKIWRKNISIKKRESSFINYSINWIESYQTCMERKWILIFLPFSV